MLIYEWIEFERLCLYLVYFIVTCIAVYFLVNYLFSKTHLAKCINELPIIEVPLWMTVVITRGIKIAPPPAIFMHILYGACYLYQNCRIFCFWAGYRPLVVFYKPETVKTLLENSKLIEKSSEYKIFKPLLGDGLISAPGDIWKVRRKMIDPAFHISILKNFMGVFNEQSMVLMKKLLDKVKEESVFNIVPLAQACTLDIICETAMGVKIQAQTEGCAEFTNALGQLQDHFLEFLVRPWLRIKYLRSFFKFGRQNLNNVKIIRETTAKVIEEKKALLKNKSKEQKNEPENNMDSSSKIKNKAFLELLLEYQQKDSSFTDLDILDEVVTIMLAGHDTSGMTLSYGLHNLGQHPEIQEKLIQEMNSIFGGDDTRSVTSEDLQLMKYTECVIKETLRLWPTIPMFTRSLNEDIKVLDYTIPPGSLCVVFLQMLHRDPESFPEPNKFDPERFFPENSIGRHPFAFIPFAAGPRNCIGQKFAMMELKVLFANFFRKLRVSSPDKHDTFHVAPGVILKNISPLRIKVTSR